MSVKLLVFTVFLIVINSVSCRLVGGWRQADLNSETIKSHANYGSRVINDRSNDFKVKKLIHIHDAKSQVVAGIKYNITIDLGKTICRKNEVGDDKLDICILDQSETIERCLITVWEKPWLQEKRLIHEECRPYLSYADYFSEKHIKEDQALHHSHPDNEVSRHRQTKAFM